MEEGREVMSSCATSVSFPARRSVVRERPRALAPTGLRRLRGARRRSELPVRLTVRGRAVLVLLFAMLAFVAFGAGRASAGAGDAAPPVTYVTVAPGETLWAVAERVVPGADPRDTVARLMEVNGVTPQSLRPGRRLAVPVR